MEKFVCSECGAELDYRGVEQCPKCNALFEENVRKRKIEEKAEEEKKEEKSNRKPNLGGITLFYILAALGILQSLSAPTAAVFLLCFPWIVFILVVIFGLLKRKKWVPKVYLGGGIIFLFYNFGVTGVAGRALGLPIGDVGTIAMLWLFKDIIVLALFSKYFFSLKKNYFTK